MYVVANGVAYVAPYGSEFLGLRDGVPIAYYRAGWIGPMVPTTAKIGTTIPKEDDE